MCSDSPIVAVPEGGELRETDRLDVNVSLSVEASSGILQLDGVDLTQSHRVGQHHPVHCRSCLTATHTHTYAQSVNVNNVTTQDRQKHRGQLLLSVFIS